MKPLILADNDTWFVLCMGVRYAIGRQSYAVGLTCDFVRNHWDEIPPRWRALIFKDVHEEIERADRGDSLLGMAMDDEEWRKLDAWMQEKGLA